MRKQEGKQDYVYVPATTAQLTAYARKLQQANRKLTWEQAFKQAQADERERAEAYARNVFGPQDRKALERGKGR